MSYLNKISVYNNRRVQAAIRKFNERATKKIEVDLEWERRHRNYPASIVERTITTSELKRLKKSKRLKNYQEDFKELKSYKQTMSSKAKALMKKQNQLERKRYQEIIELDIKNAIQNGDEDLHIPNRYPNSKVLERAVNKTEGLTYDYLDKKCKDIYVIYVNKYIRKQKLQRFCA